MIKARKELGIKGFCAVNGSQESTSLWCDRASAPFGSVVQTDKNTASAVMDMFDLGVATSSNLTCGSIIEDVHAGSNMDNEKEKKVACKVPMRRMWIGKQKKDSGLLAQQGDLPIAGKEYGGLCRSIQSGGASCSMSTCSSGVDYGGACSMTQSGGASCSMSTFSSGVDYGGACSMTRSDATSCSMSSCTLDGDYGGACSMTQSGDETCAMTFGVEDRMNGESADEEEQEGRRACDGLAERSKAGKEEEGMANFLAVGTEIVWNEIKEKDASCLFGNKWKGYMQQKLFVLDFAFQIFFRERCEGDGDLSLNRGKFRDFLFESMVERISDEVQIRYFLQQQGLFEEKEAVTDKKEATQSDCASGSTEDVPRDTGKIAGVADAEDANGTLHCGEEGDLDYVTYEEMSFRTLDEVPEAYAASGVMDDNDDWIINKRYRRSKNHGRKGQSFYARKGDGSMGHQFENHEEDNMRIAIQSASEATGSLRGGMANQFAVLEEIEEEEEEVDSIACQSEHGTEETEVSERQQNEGLDTSMSSGRSFYAEHYQRKAGMQGGAGGASTTQNKKLTTALDALAEVVKNLEPTQNNGEEDSPEAVVSQIAKLVQEWKEKTPTRGDMRAQLRRMHVLLEQDCRRQVDPAASREADSQQPKQSFYGEFVQRVREEQQPAEGWKTKGGGKGGKNGGKGKSKQKGEKAESSLPRFDLHRIWPAKAISTWQILEKELEAGKEPSGSVVIVENIEKMAEYQNLAEAHSLKRAVIMVTKAGDSEPKNINQPKVVWLPYLSNLALARAVVATTTGAAADVQGLDPIKKDKSGPQAEEMITLRIVVDLWLIEEEKKIDYLKEHPHASLHELAKGKLKEIKTHGWVINDYVISGYCSLGAKEANIVLSLSGTSGVFTSRLRQDVAAQPPVTWIKVEEKESTLNYYRRVQQLAAENNVAIARRAGGGAFLGILKEDESDRNRAWQISGIPGFWGPQSVKAWLQECGWTVENALRPPNGKFKTWAFQGRCEGHGKQSQFAYELPNGEKVHHITINHWQKKRVPTKEEVEKEQKLRGSRWWSADDTDPIEAMAITPTQKFEVAVADTAMDEDTQDNNGKRAPTPEKALPGNKKKKVDAPKPVLKGGSMGPEGSSLIDLGGSGECGWRALSCMIALCNSTHKDLDAITEKVEVLATTLRAKTISYLVQHRTRWQDSWVPDPAANTTTEAGEPAADLESFISTVLRREKRWVCGLCLAGVSLLKGCTIVVWQFVGNAEQTHLREYWKRAAIIKGKDSPKPIVIPVVLHFGHYYGLRYPALRRSWPKEWAMTKEDEDIPLTQNVDDTQKLTALSRGGEHEKQNGKGLTVDAPGSTEDVSWDINLSGFCRGGGGNSFETPKKRKIDVEELLKTFSSRRTRASKNTEDLLRTFSTKRSKASTKDRDDIEYMLRTPEHDQFPSTIKKGKHKVWSCPICQEEIKIEDRLKATSRITNHLKRLHYGVFMNAMVQNSMRNRHGAGLGMTGLVQPVPFIEMDEKDRATKAEFVCPYCDMALPLLAEGKCGRKGKKLDDAKGLTTTRRYLQRLSKQQHLRCDCEHRHAKKDVTMRQYHNDYIKKSDIYNEEWYLTSSYMEKQRKRGHEPVVFRFEKKPDSSGRGQIGKMRAICKRCRKGVSANDSTLKHECRGEESRKPWSPGLLFWKCIKMNKKNQEVKEKLGMTQGEINKAHKAARHWCTKHGRCHQQGGNQEECS